MNIEEIRGWIKNNFTNENAYDWCFPEIFQTKIAPKFPEELKIIQFPPPEGKNHNCYVFAFGLEKDDSFLMPNKRTPASSSLTSSNVQRMVNNGVLIEIKEPERGDYIIYRNASNQITHAGIVKEADSIVSKWGTGPVVEHQVLAVNPNYGTHISYYKKVDPKLIKDFFK